MNDTLLSTKQAAQHLGLQPETLMAWRSQKRGPAFIRLNGRTIRYRIDDLTAFINAKQDRNPANGDREA